MCTVSGSGSGIFPETRQCQRILDESEAPKDLVGSETCVIYGISGRPFDKISIDDASEMGLPRAKIVLAILLLHELTNALNLNLHQTSHHLGFRHRYKPP